MSGQELMALVRRHAKLLGERFPKKSENFFCPDIQDEPALLRKLYRLDPERFVRLVLEQNKREYLAGGHWAAVLLSQGGTLPEEVLRIQERKMVTVLTKVEEHTHSNGRGREWKETHEFTTALALEPTLFWEVSEKARTVWRGWYDRYYYQNTKSKQLAGAFGLRETWLGSSHTDSAQVLYSLGWKPLDVMLVYLLGVLSAYHPPVDPDCAIDAARRDPETAVKLMDSDQYKALLKDQFHPSYYVEMVRAWREVLYLQYGWTDRAPLEKGHRLKKAGLLPSETPPEWNSPKLAKLQRLTLTKAMVCHYQWRAEELLTALAGTPNPEVFTALVWGGYREDKLETVFLLDATGAARGENGEPFVLPNDAQVGLAVPVELTKKQLTAWKKRLKETGAKPLIRQLSLPVQPPEWGDFEWTQTKHITIYTVSGKWGLDMGPLGKHCRADLQDPIHGFGARIWFDGVWNGPEYNGEDVAVHGVRFYRMDPLPFGDYLPRRAVAAPEELPARFVSLAGAAFRQLAGVK